MEFCQNFCQEFWMQINANEFYRGFFYGAAGFLALMFALWFIWVVVAFCRRTRRCSSMVIAQDGGEVVVSENAIITTVKLLAVRFPALELGKVRLYCKRRGHKLVINCAYVLNDDANLLDLVENFRAHLVENLASMLGMTNELRVQVKLANVKGSKSTDKPKDEPTLPDKIVADDSFMESITNEALAEAEPGGKLRMNFPE